MPCAEATTRRGKTSTVRVTRFVFQAECMKSATLISKIVSAVEGFNSNNKPVGISIADASITVFRAATASLPRPINLPEYNPPRIEPASDARYGTQATDAICVIVRPRASVKYFGIQNR